jgi:hypothetical protein
MARRVTLRIMLATLIALAVWVPTSAATAADPCCSISLSGVPATFRAGAGAQGFSSTMNVAASNIPQQGFRGVSAQFAVAGQNLVHGQFQLSWRRQNGGNNWHGASFSSRTQNGAFIASFSPYQGIKVAGPLTIDLRLSFNSNVSPQQVTMQMSLIRSGRSGGQLAASNQAQSSVVTNAPKPTPTPTPQPTPTVTATPTETQASADSSNIAALPVGPTPTDGVKTGGSSIGWIFYIVGGLLLLVGIGVIGTMLWKRGQGAVPAGWPDPNGPHPTQPYANQGYPDQNYPDQNYPEQGYPDQAYSDVSQPDLGYPDQGYPDQGYPQPQQTPPTAAYPRPRHSAPTENYGGALPPMDPTRRMPPV